MIGFAIGRRLKCIWNVKKNKRKNKKAIHGSMETQSTTGEETTENQISTSISYQNHST